MNSLILKACLLILAAGVVFSEEKAVEAQQVSTDDDSVPLVEEVIKEEVVDSPGNVPAMEIDSTGPDLVKLTKKVEGTLNAVVGKVMQRKREIAEELRRFESGVMNVLKLLVSSTSGASGSVSANVVRARRERTLEKRSVDETELKKDDDLDDDDDEDADNDDASNDGDKDDADDNDADKDSDNEADDSDDDDDEDDDESPE